MESADWTFIRDKIAASKQKGMWMGGNPPVGYEIKDRKLIVNEDEAKTALHLFERYKEIGCVSGLKKELDSNHILSRRRRTTKGNSVGGGRYSRGALYAILQNPIYIGKIRHKDKTYDGQHESIIPEELWNNVQEILKNGGGSERGTAKPKQENLLQGLLFDCDGTRYSPVSAKKARIKLTAITSAKIFCSSEIIRKVSWPDYLRTSLNRQLAKQYAKMLPIFWIWIPRKITA